MGEHMFRVGCLNMDIIQYFYWLLQEVVLELTLGSIVAWKKWGEKEIGWVCFTFVKSHNILHGNAIFASTEWLGGILEPKTLSMAIVQSTSGCT